MRMVLFYGKGMRYMGETGNFMGCCTAAKENGQ